MTPNQLPPLSDEQIEDWIQTLATPNVWGSVLSRVKAREFARAIESATLAALAQQEQEPAAWLVSLPDEPELGEWFSEQDMSEQGYTSKPLYTTPQPQPAPSVPVDERHRAVALELDRLMLVIESAVRWQDPTHHPAVLSLLKANRAALQSTAPQATKGGEA